MNHDRNVFLQYKWLYDKIKALEAIKVFVLKLKYIHSFANSWSIKINWKNGFEILVASCRVRLISGSVGGTGGR